MANKDYYSILGVDKGASEDEIKAQAVETVKNYHHNADEEKRKYLRIMRKIGK